MHNLSFEYNAGSAITYNMQNQASSFFSVSTRHLTQHLANSVYPQSADVWLHVHTNTQTEQRKTKWKRYFYYKHT